MGVAMEWKTCRDIGVTVLDDKQSSPNNRSGTSIVYNTDITITNPRVQMERTYHPKTDTIRIIHRLIS